VTGALLFLSGLLAGTAVGFVIARAFREQPPAPRITLLTPDDALRIEYDELEGMEAELRARGRTIRWRDA
jgi:hypothetical protein